MQKELVINLLNKNLNKKKNPIILNDPYHSILNRNSQVKFHINNRWKNTKYLMSDYNFLLKIYKELLSELTKYLNKVHKKNYKVIYWENIIGRWLFTFLSITYERWLSLKDTNKNFKNIKIYVPNYSLEDFIPYGIEDFSYYTQSSFWNDYIYYEILKYFKFNSIKNIFTEKKFSNLDIQSINEKFSRKNISLKGSLLDKFRSFSSRYNKNLKYFIFETYLPKSEEIELNYQLNKKFSFFRSIKLNNVFHRLKLSKNIDLDKRTKFSKSKKTSFKNFIKSFCIKNLPKCYLEKFELSNKILKEYELPNNPKTIFTTLGISRNTIMDIYISNKIKDGTKLIIAQHGGAYGQNKIHWETIHEHSISNNFLSWGFKFNKKTKKLGTIRKQSKKKVYFLEKIILLEIRARALYSSTLRMDAGAINNYLYIKSIYDFISNINDKNILKDLRIKLHQKTFGSKDKHLIIKANKKVRFLDPNLGSKDFYNSSKIVIHTSISTGHLESLSENIPTLILFIYDLNLFSKKTRDYLEKLKKLKVLHNNYQSLINHLKKINDDPGRWWNTNEIQNMRKNYLNDFAFDNYNLKNDLLKIIKNKS